ncbi:quinone-dependent dihydroorotate dehydrogenase [soil metagenome]
MASHGKIPRAPAAGPDSKIFSSPGARLLGTFYNLTRPLLFALDAEAAHHLTIGGLRAASALGLDGLLGPRAGDAAGGGGLAVEAMGLRFPNPVGLAAGLDKNGVAVDGFGAMGFGFVEIGTLTPRPQPGNPKPRLFRLPARQAIINRMGFNNVGIAKGVENARHRNFEGVLGINIGKNFDTPNSRAIDDYLSGLQVAFPVADYVAVNLSSPNTKGLRDLQETDAFRALFHRLKDEQARLRRSSPTGRYVPIAIKLAPDLADDHARALAAVIRELEIDAVIATNTTIDHSTVLDLPHSDEAGGLSGAPLRERSTALVRLLAGELAGTGIPVIGVGGIVDAEGALEKLAAGATLVQLYSGLIYRGPALVHEILASLRQRCD